jgi:hypothetical protein
MTGLPHRLTRHFYIRQQMWALRNSSTIVRFNQSATNALQQFYGAEVIRASILINPTGIDATDTIFSESPLKLTVLYDCSSSDGSLHLRFVLKSLAEIRRTDWILDVVGDGPELEDCRTQPAAWKKRYDYYANRIDIFSTDSRRLVASLDGSPQKLELAEPAWFQAN